MNKTSEGIEVRVGQVWRDLDKRSRRLRRVVAVADGKASMQPEQLDGTNIGISKVSIARMHKHSTGWALERDA